jgi:hypothetical protein
LAELHRRLREGVDSAAKIDLQVDDYYSALRLFGLSALRGIILVERALKRKIHTGPLLLIRAFFATSDLFNDPWIEHRITSCLRYRTRFGIVKIQ